MPFIPSGNYHARRKLTVFRELLEYTGLKSENGLLDVPG
jgi:hypothetical protein